MAWFIAFLGASIVSSVLVLAAGILSSRMNRREGYVETYLSEPVEIPNGMPQVTD